MSTTSTKHEAALEYAELGYPVFPCVPGEKKPACKNGLLDATTDEARIDAWWLENPNYNIGLSTNGLLVVDIDGADNPLLSDADKMLDLAAAPSQTTPSGGRHYFFKQPDDGTFKNTQSRLADKVDTRAAGGYVVVAPSANGESNYCWLGEPLNDFLHCLPLPPQWVVDGLAKKKTLPGNANTDGKIPEGQRNGRLTSLAGSLRRQGHDQASITATIKSHNNARCKPPLATEEVEAIAASVMRYPVGSDTENIAQETRKIEQYTLAELQERHPVLKPPLVEGLFRQEETVNIIAPSKFGKSWGMYGLALSVITHTAWLGRFTTAWGRVLLIDNELHKSTLAYRIPQVGDAMFLKRADYIHDLHIWPLRGNLRSWQELATDLEKIDRGFYKLIILDAKYRFALPGTSENENSTDTLVYNLLDQLAESTGAAIALVHHSSKGDQSDKRVTDVGSGAGAQSRAADCHIVLREHEEQGVAVLEAAVRSYPPVSPLGLRWEFPLWLPDLSVDPGELLGRMTRQEQKQKQMDKEGIDLITQQLLEGESTARALRESTEMSRGRIDRLLGILASGDHVTRTTENVGGNNCHVYRLV